MATAIASYSHNHFQSLPNLNSARDNFRQLDGYKLVMEVFKDFFITNGIENTFGLSLPHRHFDILPGQLMVDYNGTSTAWNANPSKGMDEPQPVTWSFSSSGALLPYEFKYSKGYKFEMGEEELAFVAKFKCLLDEHNLAGTFGLIAYPGDDFEGTCEITMGSANINLKPKDYPEGLVNTEVGWFFSKPLWTQGCRCTCDNRENPHGHGAHIITQSA